MKNEKNAAVQESEQEAKHRYRLNKRKFTVTLAILLFAAAAIIIAARFFSSDEGRRVIAALDPPQDTSAGNSAPVIDNERPLKGKTIVVDAGHGGDDDGATGVNGSVEKKLNLSVSFLLKRQLEDKGAAVVMTRSEDSLAGTKEEDWEVRGGIISGSNADLVISVHMNWYKDSSVSGPLVLFLPGSKQGKILAESIQQSMNEALDPGKQGVSRSDNLIILKYGYQPSVLVECGYISNAFEEEKLNTEEYQHEVAEAICDGIIEYFAG